MGELDLSDHEVALRKADAAFPSPYPPDTEVRREHFPDSNGPTELDRLLAALTETTDYALITEAMIRLATREGIVPHR